MRRGVLIFGLVNLLIIAFLVHSVWTLLTLLVVDGHKDAITREELPEPGVKDLRPQLIPKIIHQTYKNTTIPERWREAQKSCQDLHPDYEYKLWTDAMARDFVAEQYPEHLEMFENYKYPIQRADAIRYFVLAHYGGIYLDLDDGCLRKLDPLLSYPAWVRRTIPTGISNDVMGAIPGHPFFERVIEALPKYNHNWILPYITIMSSTGPLFLSIMWRHYSDDHPTGVDRLRVLFPPETSKYPWSFFVYYVGNSWHGKDVDLIFWMSRHWLTVTLIGFGVGFSVLGGIWALYGRFVLKDTYTTLKRKLMFRRSSYKGYELVDRQDRHEV